jgi:glycosyltransferase involved in cell wall biosynthesis
MRGNVMSEATDTSNVDALIDSSSEPRLAVAFDATAVHATSGGVRRFASELVRALPATGIDPVVVARREDRITNWLGAQRFVAAAPRHRPLRLAWEQTSLVRSIQRNTPDVEILHSLHYTMPRGFPSLRRKQPASRAAKHRKLKSVVTIHDLSYFTRPDDHSRDKAMFFRSAIRYAATHADSLICISKRTEELLRANVEVSQPVVVIPHGLDCDRFTPIQERTVASARAHLASQYDLPRPYILHVGAIEPRKNIPNLIRAYELLLSEHSEFRDHELVLAGRAWPGMPPPVSPSLGLLRTLDFVQEADLASLYQLAAAVAYPSLEEGFGLPVLEALACGTPVVTTKGSVMESISVGATICVDTTDVLALADGLRMALTGEGPSQSARLQVARGFSWASVAQQHASLFRSMR